MSCGRGLTAASHHVRTYVRMGPGPYHPGRELERAVERGDLRLAVAIAKDITRESGRPIPLALARRLLPLVAVERPDAYDAWACRWLARWLSEAHEATIDGAADLAAALADLPSEPVSAQDTIKRLGG